MNPHRSAQAWIGAILEEFGAELRRASHGRDRSVHKARKLLQQLRAAVLLFARAHPDVASEENRRLRTLRRKLAPLRDAAARAETLRLLATRKRWALWRRELRQLATLQLGMHAKAWESRREDSPFWRRLLAEGDALRERAKAWPCDGVDEAAADHALKRARKKLERALGEGIAHAGRDARHELRRKLRRYANLRRVVADVLDRKDDEVDALLSLAKRCGHEGDLWMAAMAARRAADDHPAFADLALDLDAHRRRMCGRHDASLRKLHLD